MTRSRETILIFVFATIVFCFASVAIAFACDACADTCHASPAGRTGASGPIATPLMVAPSHYAAAIAPAFAEPADEERSGAEVLALSRAPLRI